MAVRRFAALWDVDLSDAEKPLEAYESVLELFTRRLKEGARPVDPDPGAVVSPVDGTLEYAGAIDGVVLPQAKGRTYSIDALLAEEGAVETFAGGSFFVGYLAVRAYHRVHSPVDGQILGCTAVPGDLYPVNAVAVNHVDSLYARNERVISHLVTPRFGRVDVVMVGATNVGRIKLHHAPGLETNVVAGGIVRRRHDRPVPIGRGDELGVFEFGSTVIVLTERRVDFSPQGQQSPIRMGQRLGIGPSI